jgi:hypothetical protein
VPSRLLSLSGALYDMTMRLKVTGPEDEQLQYVALSYCWGGAQPLTLTTSTLEAFQDALKVNGLPNTFQDAARITYSLGLRHLWIDALCILQDSHTDKLNEITQMPFIYSHSTLTLIASNASSVSKGFLGDRVDGRISGFNLSFRVNDRINRVLLLPEDDIQNFAYAARGSDLDDEPLSRRAWAFQERILSTRILDFRTFHTIYSCQHQEVDPVRRQMWTDGLESPTMYSGLTSSNILAKALAPSNLDGISDSNQSHGDITNALQSLTLQEWERDYSLDSPSKQWDWIIEGYSQRLITFPQDRLPAISAIGSVFQARYKSQVVAGIHLADLPLALLWRRPLILIKKIWPRPAVYCGPSWSWVSVIGRVNNYHVAGEFRMGAVTHCLGKPLRWDIQAPNRPEDATQLISLTYYGRLKPVYWFHPSNDEIDSRGGEHLSAKINADYNESESQDDLLPPGGYPLPSWFLFRINADRHQELFMGTVELDIHIPEVDTSPGSTDYLKLYLLPIATGYVKQEVFEEGNRTNQQRLDAESVWEEAATGNVIIDPSYKEHNILGYNEAPANPTSGLILRRLGASDYSRVGIFKHHFNASDKAAAAGRPNDTSTVPRLTGVSDGEVIQIYASQHKWLREGKKREIRIV